jgi:Protein of unknown function (DUF3592)
MWTFMLSYIHQRIRAFLSDFNRIHVSPEMRRRAERRADVMRLFSWIGVIVTAVAFFLYAREMAREAFALRAPGKITMFEYRDGKNPVPVFQYKLSDGRVFTSNSGFSSNLFNYQIGDDITVFYWPSSPEAGAIAGVYFTLARLLGLLGVAIAITSRLAAAWNGTELAARIYAYILIKLP